MYDPAGRASGYGASMAKKYTKPELSAILERELRTALGSPQSNVSFERLRNLQYYRAEPVGDLAAPVTPDRSQIVASDVADTVEWMLPSLVRVFAQSDDSMECEAKSPAYTEQAKLATEYLRHCFWRKNDGFDILYQWFKDALLQKVGFCKIGWDDDQRDIEETYRGLTAEQAQHLLAGDGITPIEQEQRMQDMPGAPGQQMPVFDIKVKRKEVNGRCVVAGVPPEEMRVHPRAKYGEDPLFIAQVYWRTKSQLEAEGYDLSDCSAGEFYGAEELSRQSIQSTNFTDSSDGELQRYRVSECYIQLDQDNDGVAEWLRAFMIGQTIKEEDKTDGHPFVWFCPNPLPHSFFGNCPADFAIQPQTLRTSLMRSLLDNVYLSVNKRTEVVSDGVNLDDLMNSRPGGIVRVKAPGMLREIAQAGLDSGAWQMVEWADQWREQRTGWTRFSTGMSSDALNPVTATQASLATEKADQRMELIARVAGESVKRMFGKMLKCMAQYQSVADTVELMGKWVSIDPREWADGYRIRVNVGLGTGNKDKRAQALTQVWSMQQPLAGQGAIMPQALIETARRFCEAVGVNDAEALFPDAQPPHQPGPPPQLLVEQAKAASDAQKFQAQTQIDMQEGDKQRAHDVQIKQMDIAAKLQSELLALAAGVLSAQNVAGIGGGGFGASPNILNGTTLDQTGSALAMASPQDIDMAIAKINQVAAAFANKPGMA